MDNRYMEAFAASCNLCPDDKIAKCTAVAGEIATLAGMEWPEGLEYERANLISRREKIIEQQTPVTCGGPWIVREENSMLVCGQIAGVAIVDMKSKNYRVAEYDRSEGGDSGVLRESAQP